jgi:hypothetical protein
MTDSSIIDEKKDETKSTKKNSYISNIVKFLTTVIFLFIIIVIYFATGGLILYTSKLGQTNILPTDVNCFPYTEDKPDIQPIQTNIFTTLFEDPPLSMKMSFPYNKNNQSNILLDIFRDYKNKPNSNFLANYFIVIMESVVQFNYSSFNFILNMMNSYLPEPAIVFCGPIIVSILSTMIFLLDHLYLIYLWFANMGWFFKTNTNDSNTGKPKWDNVTLIDFFDYGCSIALIILFVILFFFCFPFLSIIASLSMVWCIFSTATYKAEMNDKSITVATIVQDIFKYYKIPIMSIFSFFVIVSAFTRLGLVSGIFSIITLCLIYFGIITIDIFNPIHKGNLSKLVSYDQAKKMCWKKESKEKHGLLYDILFGQKGGSITKELKKIGKNLNRK